MEGNGHHNHLVTIILQNKKNLLLCSIEEGHKRGGVNGENFFFTLMVIGISTSCQRSNGVVY